tara:strand:- start:4501 stop:5400 length:900 start_codon:yes stop_codon:yes gene_type:complete
MNKRTKIRKIKNKKKFKTLKCAPTQNKKVDNSLKGFSCYGKEELLNMKNIWNNKNSNKITSNNPKEIWNFFKKNLSSKCYNELCWLNDQTFNSKINKDILIKSIFRPFSPKSWKNKPYEWLSSIDIIKVMTQYEKKYNNFAFIGPSPIDFDDKKLFGTCVWERLCKFDLNKYINNKSKIGIIFNTDPHYKDGSHWIALFVDIEKHFIFYFDSNGDKIPKRIKILADRIIEQGHKLNINFKFMTNEGKEHQKKDGNCGLYVLYFIIELLKGNKTPDFFKKNRVTDDEMSSYRLKYYNTPD